MTAFSPIQTWYLPDSAFRYSFSEMALDGTEGNEGVMLWLGRRGAGKAEITHSVALRGPGVIKRPDYLNIAPELLNEVADLTIELNVSLVGQIHSHGHQYRVDLSYTDRTYGIKVPYYLSIVAPDYAMRDATEITECGVHIFEPGVGFRRFSELETIERVKIIVNSETPLLIVGEE